jgi:hypothetical protein
MPKHAGGRPRIEFLQDPDRYLLAVAAAFPDLGTSRRGAIEITVAAIEGYAVGPNRRPGWGRGLNLLYEEYRMRRGGAATISNRSRELRRKMKRAAGDPVAARWLAAMSQGLLLALWAHAPGDDKNVGDLITELAASVGDEAFAREVLLVIWRNEGQRRIAIAIKKSVSADYLPPDF